MNMLMKFIDWRRGAVNALKWYGQVLCALAEPEESLLQTEIRLFELYGTVGCCAATPKLASSAPAEPDTAAIGCDISSFAPGDEFCSVPAEIREFLPVFFRAWFRLDDRERCILREFYLEQNRTTLDAIMRISEKLSYERSRIYDLKKDALSRLAFMLFKHL